MPWSTGHTQKAVNQRLHEVAKHLTTTEGAGVIEVEGGGIREALAETRDADLHRPRFSDNGVRFTVQFRRGQVFTSSDLQRISELAPDVRLSHIQKVLLLSLSDGEPWSITRMREEFSPLSRTEAQIQIDGLVRQGPVTETATGIHLTGENVPATGAESDAGESPASPETPAVTEQAGKPGQHDKARGGATDQDVLRSITRHGPAVVAALDADAPGPGTTHPPVGAQAIADRVGLSVSTTRYALNRLIAAGIVEMVGGQGQHDTGYRRYLVQEQFLTVHPRCRSLSAPAPPGTAHGAGRRGCR